ncbi:hypothetical protein AAG570_006410 [Ranatra chinensis]|uniref:Uncharacterized protein n=1 Tax=Ranatra chinensis TaxID=642074 RepID=A0ABD0YTZ8_9HEMI
MGCALYPNGDYYEGEYRNGLRNGSGKYVFKNGARYIGHYHKGMKQGVGTFIYPDGTIYEGEWKADLKHGYGAYYYANDDVYEGQWRNGFQEGMGCYTCREHPIKYMGTWEKGKMCGPGQIMTRAFRYHGIWKDNFPMGSGCFTFNSDCMQHGYYVMTKDPQYDKVNVGEDEQQEEGGEKDPYKGMVPIWHPREVTSHQVARLPPAPKPFEYPESEISVTPPSELEEPSAYKYDFFKDIAQYDNLYLDEKVLMQYDSWDMEVIKRETPTTKDTGGECEGKEGDDPYLNPDAVIGQSHYNNTIKLNLFCIL